MAECEYNYFTNKTIIDICNLSKKCEYDYINIYELHFCYFEGKLYFSIPIFIFICLICFYLLSDTANKYLSTALTNISEILNLSQNLAGVTILAFGNGAPDVISSIVAGGIGEGSEGLDISIASLLGGGMFVSCFVFSLVILFGKRVKVNKGIFYVFLFLCYAC
jgi:sodium/potassium/calcium exchanger 6